MSHRTLHPSGEDHYAVKLNWRLVRAIRRAGRRKSSYEWARELGCCETTVREARDEKTWDPKDMPLWHSMDEALSLDLTPAFFLKWIRDRLVLVHGDSELYDFVRALDRVHKEIALEEAYIK